MNLFLSRWCARTRVACRSRRSLRDVSLFRIEPLEARVVCSATSLAATIHPLNVPAYHSLPGAPVSLYIDFDGDVTSDWDVYHPGSTPAFDSDGDPTTFSDDELTLMQDIWARVSEMYSPFNIDVTTEDPGAVRAEQTERVVVGGDGSWTGLTGSGLSEVNSFSDPNRVNLSWAFLRGPITPVPAIFDTTAQSAAPVSEETDPNAITNEKTIANTIAHEAGHAFGLNHQRTFNPDGSLNSEYNGGYSVYAPIMGTADLSQRALWWNGPSATATDFQDDLAILTREVNGFGYRPDEAGATADTAVALPSSANGLIANGVITTHSDVDMYSFDQTTAGAASIQVNAASHSAMLNAAVDVLNAEGNVVATADTGTLSENLTLSLPAGHYFVAVRSHGLYGDIGQYTLTVHPDAQLPTAATFKATAVVNPHDDVHLTIKGVSAPYGKVSDVQFFLDSDNNGNFDPGVDTLLGQVNQFTRKGNASFTFSSDLLPPTYQTIFAVPRDSQNVYGQVLKATVAVQKPVDLFADPKSVVAGDPVKLSADNMFLPDTVVVRADFYLDVNSNGKIDRRDKLVGSATRDDDWSMTFDTTGFKAGQYQFLATAVGQNRKKEIPGLTAIVVHTRPLIGSVHVFHEPQLPFPIYTVEADGVQGTESPVDVVNFYLDSNGNGQLDDDDRLLNTVNPTGTTASLRFSADGVPSGSNAIFAVAQDLDGRRSLPAMTTLDL